MCSKYTLFTIQSSMHKKKTTLHHSYLANNLMSYIHENIQTDINIDQLATEYGISKFHLHKIFKEQMGKNIYESIKSIRLQKASNLLVANPHSSITEVANMCGYASQTSFIRAFKQRFDQTPKMWRKGAYREYSNKILKSSHITSMSKADFSHIKPKIVKTETKTVYYIRHQGYNRKATHLWQKMMVWVYTNEIEEYEQVAIYHDNPILTPLEDCHYVACIAPKDTSKLSNTSLPTFDMTASVCAAFEVEGEYCDIIIFIQWVYHKWLPNSGFETATIPPYTIFEKNHFLSDDGRFKCTYYLPVRYAQIL